MAVCLECAELAPLFSHCFGCLGLAPSAGGADPEYRIRRTDAGFALERPRGKPLCATDEGDLLQIFDGELAVALQRLRPDLLFLHAGALATRDGAALLAGDSGAGKSTLTWVLASRGAPYLSDELAAICPETLQVHPFPRAISLKTPPPRPFELPAEALATSRGFRVRPGQTGCVHPAEPRRVTAIFFLQRGSPSVEPATRRMGSAEAAARLLANSLNPRAHRGDGLDAALAIASSAACLELRWGDLGATAERVWSTVDDLDSPVGRAARD